MKILTVNFMLTIDVRRVNALKVKRRSFSAKLRSALRFPRVRFQRFAIIYGVKNVRVHNDVVAYPFVRMFHRAFHFHLPCSVAQMSRDPARTNPIKYERHPRKHLQNLSRSTGRLSNESLIEFLVNEITSSFFLNVEN